MKKININKTIINVLNKLEECIRTIIRFSKYNIILSVYLIIPIITFIYGRSIDVQQPQPLMVILILLSIANTVIGMGDVITNSKNLYYFPYEVLDVIKSYISGLIVYDEIVEPIVIDEKPISFLEEHSFEEVNSYMPYSWNDDKELMEK